MHSIENHLPEQGQGVKIPYWWLHNPNHWALSHLHLLCALRRARTQFAACVWRHNLPAWTRAICIMYTCTRMHNSPHVFRDRTQFTIHFSQIHNLPPCTWAVRNSQFPALRYDSQLASCECGRTQLRRRSINQPAWDSKIWRGENIGKPFEPQLNVFCSRFDRSV